MDADRLRAYLLTLPHTVETMQWGDNLVFWVGDKAIGGKMFALINLETPGPEGGESEDGPSRHGVVSYAAGPARYAELLELEGVTPAPYFARIHWVAVERWNALPASDWQAELRAAHALVYAKLPQRVRATLDLPPAELKRRIAAQRKLLTERAGR